MVSGGTEADMPAGIRRALHNIGLGLGIAAAGYAVLVTRAYWKYGKPLSATPDQVDPALDRFMPSYEIAERHHVRVSAPADVTLRAAAAARLQESPIVTAIFKARELMLRAEPSATDPRGLLEQTLALGWRVLHEGPEQIVVGAVTQPWLPDVVFRGLAPDAFKAFNDPGYVKII
jgi:hypothetical protein